MKCAIKVNHPNDRELQEIVDEAETDIREKVEEVQQVPLSPSGNARSLVDTILHDGRAPLAKVKNEADLGRKDIKQGETECNGKTRIDSPPYSAALNHLQAEAVADRQQSFLKTSSAMRLPYSKAGCFLGRVACVQGSRLPALPATAADRLIVSTETSESYGLS